MEKLPERISQITDFTYHQIFSLQLTISWKFGKKSAKLGVSSEYILLGSYFIKGWNSTIVQIKFFFTYCRAGNMSNRGIKPLHFTSLRELCKVVWILDFWLSQYSRKVHNFVKCSPRKLKIDCSLVFYSNQWYNSLNNFGILSYQFLQVINLENICKNWKVSGWKLGQDWSGNFPLPVQYMITTRVNRICLTNSFLFHTLFVLIENERAVSTLSDCIIAKMSSRFFYFLDGYVVRRKVYCCSVKVNLILKTHIHRWLAFNLRFVVAG